MITLPQWEELVDRGEFADMQASFNKNLTPKNLAAWYRQIERLEMVGLKETLKALTDGDKFPSFKDFRVKYKYITGTHGAERQDYCGLCHDGWISGLKFHAPYGIDITYVNHCKLCYPERETATDPRDAKIRWTESPESFNKRKRQRKEYHRNLTRQILNMTGLGASHANEGARQRNLNRVGYGAETPEDEY